MRTLKISITIFMLLIVSTLFAQPKEEPKKNTVKAENNPAAAESADSTADSAKEEASPFQIGGVFGGVSIDGKNYQQIGLRPELALWKFGLGLDLNILIDERGNIRKEDWDQAKDYIDKLYYIRYGTKGETLYTKFGGLDATTLGYGTVISGYTNMLEYPSYKRQGVEIGSETKYAGIELIAGNLKELAGKTPGVMGGGRLYVKPFSRLQIGGSIAGDLNEYKGLRDTDGDGFPDEIDKYPNNDDYVTDIDYYTDHLGTDAATTIPILVNHGLISSKTRADLDNPLNKRSKTGFWSADAGIRIIDMEIFKFDIYTQCSQSINTRGWGYTAPGIKFTGGDLIEIYADYRQQSDKFIFGYYNDTYDLERAKYVDDGSGNLIVNTKKNKLKTAKASKGYFAGVKINFFDFVTGKMEYQDMRWGEDWKMKDKSVKGELAVKQDLIPMVSKAKAYYVQNNVKKLQWKTESTVLGGVVGLRLAEGVSVDFNYLITYVDKNGDGKISGKEEEIRSVSVATTSLF